MSDTQTNISTGSAAPTSPRWRDRLGAAGLQIGAVDPSQGLLDAFAEIFSQMAATKAPSENRTQPSPDSSERETDDERDPVTQQDERPRATSSPEQEPHAVFVDIPVDTQNADHEIGEHGMDLKPQANVSEAPSSRQHPSDVPIAEDRGATVSVASEASVSEQVPSSEVQSNVTVNPSGVLQPGPDAKQRATEASKETPVLGVGGSKPQTAANEVEARSVPPATAPLDESQPNESDVDDDSKQRRGRRRERANAVGGTDKQGNGQRLAEAANTGRNAASQNGAAAMPVANAAAAESAQSVAPTSSVSSPPVDATSSAVVSSAAAALVSKVTSAITSSSSGPAVSGLGRSDAASGTTVAAGVPTSGTNAAGKKQAGQSANSATTDLISRAKLIQRVSKAFQHMGPDGGHVRLRLAPAELGTVRLEMHIHQHKMQTRVVAETEAAASALREHLPELRMRLESQGMQVEKLSIEVESDSLADNSSNHGHSASEQNMGEAPGRRRWQAPRPEPQLAQDAADAHRRPTDAGQSPWIPTAGMDVRL
ncbi:flagellar hook-length control protein FliK [Novipirellula artificiosorum]|uniref:Flagellar hook-length control protein FliK n=1 Tax=Novipirellula artificiosorum TaxID=2528016 RepID=A0A5C6E194_9BACT|nr:flagellar hook-length control protein FliK [Novipirellula artificiosorum]TWU41747.1 Flagellar hook-length control protein FliK [Novipirellula artificiosorum]